jgi:anti-sigma regulatory factor (Ser/Thr protein kinase)
MLHDLRVPSGNADALIQLPALPSAASAGRRFVKAVLQIRGVSELEDVALLCTSELVTNAVKATDVVDDPIGSAPETSGVNVCLCVAITKRQIRIEVWDTSSSRPVPRDAGADDECGRGLALVDAVSDRWGSDPLDEAHARGPCKVTWCEWDRAALHPSSTRFPVRSAYR